MANNHALDFGQAIYDDTAAVLDGAGIGHAGEGEGVLYTTDNGLVVGIYAVHNGHYPDANAVAQAVRDLKEAGAEIVVVSAHWGNEASTTKMKPDGPWPMPPLMREPVLLWGMALTGSSPWRNTTAA